jgi:predicted aspartyl protease
MPIRDIPFTDGHAFLDIRIINPDNQQDVFTRALVDTGAGACAFSADIATILGLNLTKGIKHEDIGTGGGNVTGYGHSTVIEILDSNKRVLYTTKKIQAIYLPNLTGSLLGVHGFLENFHLHIDYPRKQFSIYKPRP